MLARVSSIAEVARGLLSYNPEDGLLTWRVNRKGGVRAGAVAGCAMPTGYIKVGLNGREYLAHRLAWLITHGEWPEAEIDHANGDRADNRLVNLRPATRSENSQNLGARANNSSGFAGVTWNKARRKWQAQITTRGRHKVVGTFDTPGQAGAAYQEAKAALHAFAPTVRAE